MNLEPFKQEHVAKGITQKYMTEALDFKDRSSHWLIEKGKCSVDIELVNRIASVLNSSERRTFEIFLSQKFKHLQLDFN